MTTFKEIRGTAIQSVSSDPSNPEVGQIWYNNTIGVLKGYRNLGGVFSSGGNVNTARDERAGGAGTVSAGLSFGGFVPPVTGSTATEEYNGTSWTTSNPLSVGSWNIGGCGTQTAGLAFGGFSPPGNKDRTEEYDGTSWTAGGNLNLARRAIQGFGTQTAAVNAGGGTPTQVTNVEEYNGSTWTNVTAIPAANSNSASCGSESAGTVAGGGSAPVARVALDYDGSAWTTLTSLNEDRISATAGGVQDDVLVMGGNDNLVSTTSWNGIAWSANASMANGRGPTGSGAGANNATTSGVLIAMGYNGTSTISNTEEFTDPTLVVQKLTTS